MKIIMAVLTKTESIEPENVALIGLLVHTLLWFVLGGMAGYVAAICVQVSEVLKLSYVITAGAVCALVLGYIGGVVYLLREEA